ncbi:MAG: 30S ribosomal protein S3 [Candidatus Wolfebacteria bacterium]|nr:30S ribosomal protein S3 [Candidatus Wolfebacteria bacterium]
MGQKIKPNSFRLGIIRDWNSRWFPKKGGFKTFLEEDVLIRDIIKKKIGLAGIDQVLIERSGNGCRISIRAAKPGLIIGRGGKGIEDLINLIKRNLTKLRKEKGTTEQVSISLNIEEIKRSEVSASVVAQNIAKDLERRMPFRRLIKKYLESILQNREVKGAKIKVAGRLDGAEIARNEHLAKGNLPLQTLRTNIDYGQATAHTTYGTIGVKVWINKGEVFEKKINPQ